jgi:hypothetical protein
METTYEITVTPSTYGTPEPGIEARFPKGTHFRVAKAAIYAIAAAVELATAKGEKWCVTVEAHESGGRVFLELLDGTPAEASRGIDTLVRALASVQGKA